MVPTTALPLNQRESAMCAGTFRKLPIFSQNNSTVNLQSMAIMFIGQLCKKKSSGGLCTVARIQFVIWSICEAQRLASTKKACNDGNSSKLYSHGP